MVIVHLVEPAEYGGRERVVQMLCQGLHGLGHEVHVIAVGSEPKGLEPFCSPLADAGVRTHAIVIPPRAYGRERAAVADLCRRLRPDVVHTHGYRPDVLHGSGLQRRGLPMVTTVHGFTGGGWKNRFYEWLQVRAFRRYDAVVVVSRPLVDRMARAGVPRARIHAIPNAWRPSPGALPLGRAAARAALGIARDDFVLGWVGRLSREKGADVLLRALPHLRDLPLSVSVLGTGAEQVRLQTGASRLGLDQRIRWHGAVPDAGRLFPAFDAFVLSSRTEGTPVSLLEAMAAGVPVVTTQVGGVPDVVSPAEAVLVRSDDPGNLAAGIRAVYDDPTAARRRASAAAARLLRDFSVGPWLDRYETVYGQVRESVPAVA
jgi:glycosyltransferase involved in cell wall biosynthesis